MRVSCFLLLFVSTLAANLEYDGPVNQNLASTFDLKGDKLSVIEFYAPWCPHCQHFAPTYGQLATAYNAVPDVQFFAVNCAEHGATCSDNNVKGFPTLQIQQSGKSTSTYSGDKSTESLTDWISTTAKQNGVEVEAPAKVIAAPAWQHEKKSQVPASPVKYQDLSTTIFNTMKQVLSMASKGHLPAAETQALRMWLQRLQSLPEVGTGLDALVVATTAGTTVSLNRLQDETKNLYLWGFSYTGKQSAGLRGSKVSGGTENWGVCKGAGHEYPCGLWQLLHTLTVHCKDGDAGEDARQVLTDIRQFVAVFFPCEQCRSHFLATSKDVVETITSRRDAIIWLWRTHNAVSKRLSSVWGLSKKQVLYPPVEACKDCRVQETWNETRVLQYLESTFACGNTRRRAQEAESRSFGRRQSIISRLFDEDSRPL